MPRSVRTIGQVMKTLKPDFPDLSISKIRFLESEGLLSPERAPSGYRKYSDSDVERLRYILTCQRDHFQPLRVIRDHLEMMARFPRHLLCPLRTRGLLILSLSRQVKELSGPVALSG